MAMREKACADAVQTIKDRRSINFFDPAREVPDEELREILSVANLAPSSFNFQPWKVIAVRTPERKRALRACANNQSKAEEASVVLIMVADPRALEENIDRALQSWVELGYMPAERIGPMKGLADALYGPPESEKRRLFAVKNTALFAMNFMIAAKSMGYETHPMDGIDEECIKREFGIREDCSVPMLVAVGFLKPGVELLPRAFRRPLDEFASFI